MTPNEEGAEVINTTPMQLVMNRLGNDDMTRVLTQDYSREELLKANEKTKQDMRRHNKNEELEHQRQDAEMNENKFIVGEIVIKRGSP